MNKYTVEMLDEYIRLQEIVNDHQIRCVITFDSHLNINKLKAAITKTVEYVPLLSCTYRMVDGQPFWEEVPFNIDAVFFIESDNHLEDHYPEYFSRIPKSDGPQICFFLIHQEKNDVLIINVNHMIFDGSGFKAYLYLLASLYSNVENPMKFASKVRSMDRLLKNVKPTDRLTSLFRKTLNTAKIDLLNHDDSDVKPRLGRLKMDADQVNRISTICHQNQFTLNDFIMGLFASSILRIGKVNSQEKISIQMMFDLRRYVNQYPVSDFANFSSMESVVIQNTSQSVFETIKAIGAQTSRIKAHFPGIKNVILLNSLYRLLPVKKFDGLVARTIQSLGFSTSNLGVIDDQKLCFSDSKVIDCAMFASIKKQPSLQCSFSTFQGSISLSILGDYSATNWIIVEKLLETMKDILHEIDPQTSL